MTALKHFFVLHRPGQEGVPWPVEEIRLALEGFGGGPWQLREAGPLLAGWQGEPCPDEGHPFLLAQGDPGGAEQDIPAPDLLVSSKLSEARRLDGAFAALAFDPAGRAALVTDRFGLFPVYQSRQAELTGYSTSLRLLAALLRLPCAVDEQAVAEMLVLQMVLGDRTLLRDIRLVPPATVLRLGDGPPQASPYWGWQHLSEQAASSPSDLVHSTYQAIERAVLRSVPPGVRKVALPLSGGLDSRLLAAVLARHGVPVQAYNVDFGSEARIARQVAQTLRIPLRGLPLYDRPSSIPAAHAAIDAAYHVNQVWGWSMARAAAEDGCDVLFDGLAFDAVLGSVHYVGGDGVASLARNLEGNYADVNEDVLARPAGRAGAGRIFGHVRASLEEAAREALGAAGARASDYFIMTNRVRKYTFGYCLANCHALPGRFPYVTTRLFEHCLGLPLWLRLEHNLYRRLYRELFPELACIPWAKTGLPLDRYRSAGPSRAWQYLEAGVRRLTRGRLTLSQRGDFDDEFRRRPEVRSALLPVLEADLQELEGVLPAELAHQAVAFHLGGRNLGGLLQGLFTVKHFQTVLARAAEPAEDNEPLLERVCG